MKSMNKKKKNEFIHRCGSKTAEPNAASSRNSNSNKPSNNNSNNSSNNSNSSRRTLPWAIRRSGYANGATWTAAPAAAKCATAAAATAAPRCSPPWPLRRPRRRRRPTADRRRWRRRRWRRPTAIWRWISVPFPICVTVRRWWVAALAAPGTRRTTAPLWRHRSSW